MNTIFFREIAFLAVFPVQKLIFGHVWNCKKWNLVKKIIRDINLFDFTSILAWPFFKFSGPLWNCVLCFFAKKKIKYISMFFKTHFMINQKLWWISLLIN